MATFPSCSAMPASSALSGISGAVKAAPYTVQPYWGKDSPMESISGAVKISTLSGHRVRA